MLLLSAVTVSYQHKEISTLYLVTCVFPSVRGGSIYPDNSACRTDSAHECYHDVPPVCRHRAVTRTVTQPRFMRAVNMPSMCIHDMEANFENSCSTHVNKMLSTCCRDVKSK